MVHLSNRLKTAADMIRPCEILADIGTDHGLLPIYAVKSGIAKKAIAMDVRKEPIRRATDRIMEFGLSDFIETRLSDGLDMLKSFEADALTITGMGGILMEEILSKGLSKLKYDTQLILSPQSGIGRFRHFLSENGFFIRNEIMLRDGHKYYNIIDCVFYGESSDIISYNSYREVDYEFGRILLKSKDECLKEFLEKELSDNMNIYAALCDNVKEGKEMLIRRLEDVENRISLIKLALSELSIN